MISKKTTSAHTHTHEKARRHALLTLLFLYCALRPHVRFKRLTNTPALQYKSSSGWGWRGRGETGLIYATHKKKLSPTLVNEKANNNQ